MIIVELEGKEYQLDIEQAKQSGILKEVDNRVRSWDEFKDKYRIDVTYAASDVLGLERLSGNMSTRAQLTPHEAMAIDAFSKLLKLRRDWIGEWEPDWENTETECYVLECIGNEVRIYPQRIYSRSLSFPTKQMAHEFLEIFRDLIEKAKILI